MGERNDRLSQGYIDFGRTLAGMLRMVSEGAVLAGADVMGGFAVFVTKHTGIIATVKSLGAPQKVDPNMLLPVVDGELMLRTLADFEYACRVRIGEEQEKPNSDTPLIALLCDAVRLSRELRSQGTAPVIQ